MWLTSGSAGRGSSWWATHSSGTSQHPAREIRLVTYKVIVTNNVRYYHLRQLRPNPVLSNDANPPDNFSSVTTTVAVNPTPIAFDDFYSTGKNEPLTIPSPGVLNNDSNALFAVLSAILFAGPNSGTLAFDTNGSFLYVPPQILWAATSTPTCRQQRQHFRARHCHDLRDEHLPTSP